MVRAVREAAPLRLKYLGPHELKPSPNNARSHPVKQIRALAKSIERFGFLSPVLIDANNNLLCGHGRIEAAKLLGLKAVPVVCADTLSDAERRAFMLADNRLSEFATWDRDKVAIELKSIADLGFPEIEVTGFTLNDIDVRLDEDNERKGPDTGPDDALPDVDRISISQPGDLWVLGDHRLFCGNSLDASSYDRVLQGSTADCVVTDAPFNLSARSITGPRKTSP